MKQAREFVSYIADIFGILSFIGVSAGLITAWFKLIPIWFGLIIGVAGLALGAIAVIRVRRSTVGSTILNTRRIGDKQMSIDVADLRSLLPSEESVKDWHKKLITYVRNWDKNAAILSYEVTVLFGALGPSYTAMIKAESPWKSLLMTAYIKHISYMPKPNDYNGRVHQHLRELEAPTATKNRAPFFKKYRNWRNAVLYSYGPLEHIAKDFLSIQWGDGYRINDEVFRVELRYGVGGIRKGHYAFFDEKQIQDPSTVKLNKLII